MSRTTVNWNRQAALAAALLVLGMSAYWLEFKHKPEEANREAEKRKLFNLKDAQIKDVLVSGNGHVFEIKCSDATATLCKPGENSKWELRQPLKLKADDSNSNALISTLNNLSASDTIDLKDETPEKRSSLLKEYGLDPQARGDASAKRIEVTTSSGATVLYLGVNHPIGEGIFAVTEAVAAGAKPSGKVDDSQVYLVPTYFKANFDHDLTYWRDKRLVTAAAHDLESFQLKDPKTEISGTRKDAQWTLRTPKGEEFPGDIEGIDNLLTAAAFLSAKSFVSDDKKDAHSAAALKGTRPVVTLTLQPEKGAGKEAPPPIVLTLFQKARAAKTAAKGKNPPPPSAGLLYATVSNLDPLYELEPNAVDRLDKGLKDLRLAKLISSMDRFKIKRIEFSGKPLGEPPLVIQEKAGVWTNDKGANLEGAMKVQTLLDRLSGNRVTDFLTGAGIPPGEADGLTVKLEDDQSKVLRQLVFWKSNGKSVARDARSDRKEALLVDANIQDALPPSRAFFEQKREPLAPPAGKPGIPVPPPASRLHGMPPMPGAPPEPGKALIPVPPQPKTK